MRMCFIIVVICLISSTALAQEVSFTYKEDGRDPFIPLVSKDGKLMVTYGAINSINDVILEGILFDSEGESVVIMNDLVLKANDQIGNMKIKANIDINRKILLSSPKIKPLFFFMSC